MFYKEIKNRQGQGLLILKISSLGANHDVVRSSARYIYRSAQTIFGTSLPIASRMHWFVYEELLLKINPFHANSFFLYPQKTSENQNFSDFFMGYRNRTIWNGLTLLNR